MGQFVGFLVFFALVVFMIAAKGGRANYSTLLTRGISGRGILLAVSSVPVGQSVGFGLVKYQQRQVTIDIEVPGKPPYEISGTTLVPLNLVRDVLPGATVEVRVDPKNPTNIAIVGPGVGFNANSLMTQGQYNQGAA